MTASGDEVEMRRRHPETNVDEPQHTRPSPPPAPARRLTRPTGGRVLGGVAAGVADHLRLDRTLVRVLFVLAAVLLNGLGLLAYGLLWLLVPSQEVDDPTLEGPGGPPAVGDEAARVTGLEARGARGAGFWLGLGLVVWGGLWLLSTGGPTGWMFGAPAARGWLLPLALIGFGAALWLAEERRGSDLGDPRDASVAGASDVGGAGQPPPPSPARPAGPPPPDGSVPAPAGPPPAPPPVERERSILGRVTIGLALLATGVTWLAGQAALVTLRPATLFAVPLLVIGLGLLIGSWWGRARLLLLAGLPLLGIVLVVTTVDLVVPPVPLSGNVGDARVVVSDESQLLPSYQHGAGSLVLDLRELELERDAATRLEMGAGEVSVLVPDGQRVEVTGEVTVGEINLFGQRRAGLGARLGGVAEGEAGSTLTIDVRVGAGQLEVRRDPSARDDDAPFTPTSTDDAGWPVARTGSPVGVALPPAGPGGPPAVPTPADGRTTMEYAR